MAENEPNFTVNPEPGPKTDDIGISVPAPDAGQPVIGITEKASAQIQNVESAQPQETASAQKQKSIYGEVPQIPVLDAVEGIKFDFNHGIRILFPHNDQLYHVTFTDIDTGIILYSADTVPGAYVTSVKKFFIRFRLIIHRKGGSEPIFVHDYDATGKDVMIQLPVGTIGDSIGWFSYVERFQLKHNCRVICVMTPWIADLVRGQYPDITFIAPEDTLKYQPYACYYMGLFFRGDVDNQPIDFRYIGLHRTAGYILGVDPADIPPRFNLSAPRKIKEKYVCIAAQSSSQAKYWNNPYGWLNVVQFLKDNGYRVLCIDRDKVHGTGLNWNYIPYGAEDFTGALPLQERVDLIKDADFFVGLSSGLSWIAWGCKVPVVMISGFTHPTNEFATPYRVINYHTCHSCWNDMRENFDHYDFLWCPRHKGTERHFECTRLISADQVISTIKKIPSFRPAETAPVEKDFNPGAFDAANETEAKRILLPAQNDAGTAERWVRETPVLTAMAEQELKLAPGMTVVDYGCGIGRLAKELCAFGCRVVGVEPAASLRKLAVKYVGDPEKFKIVSPEEFDAMLDAGFSCDGALAVWVLQHALKPDSDLVRLERALKPGAGFFVVNNKSVRAVPVKKNQWQDDGVNIWDLCSAHFLETDILPFPPGLGVNEKQMLCRTFKKR